MSPSFKFSEVYASINYFNIKNFHKVTAITTWCSCACCYN